MIEELKVIIKAEVDNFKKGLDEATKQTKTFSEQVKENSKKADENIKNMGKATVDAAKVMAAGIGAATAALGSMVKSSIETADNIDKMSQKIGISRQAYQEWSYIAGQCGVEVDVFKNGVKTLTTQMDAAAKGTKSSQEAFDALGLSVTDASGNLKNQETMMEEAIAALAGMEDGTERARLAQQLFGKAGTELAPILNEGAGGIEELRSRCHELGLVMNDETIDAGVTLGDTIDDVKSSFGAITNSIGAELMPIVQDICDYIIEKLPDIKDKVKELVDKIEDAIDFAKEHKGLLIGIGTAIGVITTAIGAYNIAAAIKDAMDKAHVATLGALISAQAAQAAATLAALAPYVLIVAAIAAVIAIIVLCIKNWDKIKATVIEVADKIKSKVSDMKDAVKNKFESMKTAIITPIENAKNKVKTLIDNIKSFFNFKWELPKLKMPHLTISGKFSIDPPQVPKFSISWYARGGVFDKPTLFGYGNGSIGGLGEKGAEAVVPLENNTKWLDKIAERLNKNSTTPIILQVDGKTFAQTSISTINELTKQTGKLGLVLG